MGRPLKAPPAGEVWLHVDRLDRPDGLIWAVQSVERGKPVYRVAEAVIVFPASYTAFHGAKAAQPRAVIVVPGGKVTMRGKTALVT